ncbi:MAG: hypothetical protein JJE40_14320 [Vicinamibacteria bacterium]|nr:hypothetical protein [Vicinamibacteria bacterium]
MRITHIGPLSVAKVAFVLYGVIGLIFGACFAVVALFGASLGVAAGEESSLLGAVFGVGAVILLPLLYGGLGAVMGLFMAWLYNVVAGLVGGIDVRTE